MFVPNLAGSWLARVHHDLVKRLVWVARDLSDAGREPRQGELVATLYDDEGQPVTAATLWESLREEAPNALGVREFGTALQACVAAAQRNDIRGVLELEPAFDRLKATMALSLNQPEGANPPSRKAR